MKISLAMIVKNEERYIERCIKSVIEIVDEIVIVDTGSTDSTISIIKQFPNAKIFNFNWCDDFSSARNYSIGKTTGDYILVLDADEYIVEGTRSEFEKIMEKNYIGKILIESPFKKKNQEQIAKAYISRFFPRGTRYIGIIHEQLESNRPRIQMNVKVNHDGYFETNKSQRNIPLLIREIEKNTSDSYYLFQLGKELRINEQYNLSFNFLKKAYSITQKNVPYYGELVVELINSGKESGEIELFEIISHNEDILEDLADFHFAKSLFYMDYFFKHPNYAEKYLGKIESGLKECLYSKFEYLKGTGSFLALYNLGVYYEVSGNIDMAIYYYKLSSEFGYSLANIRLEALSV